MKNESLARTKNSIIGCIKNNLINGWPVMLIIFVIYLLAGPVFLFVTFKDDYERLNRNMQNLENAYDVAREIREEGYNTISENAYYTKYGKYTAVDYYRVNNFLTALDMDEYYDEQISYYMVSLEDSLEEIYGTTGIIIACVIGFAIVFFVAKHCFAFDKGKKNTDFYGALPVTRYEYYISSVICTLIFSIAPIVVSGLLTVPALAAAKATEVVEASVLWSYAGKYILSAFLRMYDFIALAVIANIVGNTVGAAMVNYGILNFYIVAFLGLGCAISNMAGSTFENYLSKIVGMEEFLLNSSPFLRMIFSLEGTTFALEGFASHLIWFIVSTAILAGGCFIFALRRAENSVLPCSFRPVRYVVQYMSMIVASLAVSMLFEAMSNTGIIGICVMSIISCFLSFICLNALFEGSLRLLLKNARHMFILFGSVVFLTIFVFGDIFGVFNVPDPTERNFKSVTLSFNDQFYVGVTAGPTEVTITRSSSEEAKKVAMDIIKARKTAYGYENGSESVTVTASTPDVYYVDEELLKYGYQNVPLEKKLYSDEPVFETIHGSLKLVGRHDIDYIEFMKQYVPYMRVTVRYGIFEDSFSLRDEKVSNKLISDIAEFADLKTPFEDILKSDFAGEVSACTIYESALCKLGVYNGYAKKFLSDNQLSAFKVALKKDLDNAKPSDFTAPSRYIAILKAKNTSFKYDSGGISIPESFTNTIGILREFGCILDVDDDLETLTKYVIGVDKYDEQSGTYKTHWDVMNRVADEKDEYSYSDDAKVKKFISENIFVPYDLCYSSLLSISPKEYYKVYATAGYKGLIITFDVCTE
ncbi:MAG: DMT family transporter [Ruminococcaceae bacterium]|nr:DMT family transporter [Oscillospiraceae bacterium]